MKTLVVSVVAAAGLVSTAHAQSSSDASFEKVERGRYLAVLGDCAACHTTAGGKPLAGGVVLRTPFGNLVGANITPDTDTGIGKWTLDDFQRVMSEGLGRGGFHLYGAMPYPAYTKVSKEDNAALWAYVQTVEPVKSPVEPNQLPFPFNVRLSLIGWNLLNFTRGEFRPDPARSAEWNRGAYLVQGLGHCGSCHTPKSLTGGDKNSEFLQGGTLDNWYAPDITADTHKGIGSWSSEDIVQYLKTGTNHFDIASGPMAEMVEKSSQHWTDPDLRAVAVYLRSVEGNGIAVPLPVDAHDKRMVAGRAIYADRCAACHVGSGEGVAKLFPKLAGAPLANNDDATSLIRVVLAGNVAGATNAMPTAPAMPSFAWNLSDEEIASVLTYVRNSWGNAAPPVDAPNVAALRKALQE
ncbi:c-type cytochrome [Mesorhizobium sp. B1-1-8]|uniref:c-type cytochrome n=1 Tax=Mesorhizobium sp. B1-1-8 TaxID=2589976 RepID=UPI001126819D|nr:cytochrome c [Mesorhizobium sp. B1-1-8]UCI05190.1 cytochrome c [Mesorhizobium sp. B1-1-8]